MKYTKVALILLVLPVLTFGTLITEVSDNPALILEDSREFFDMDLSPAVGLTSNLLSVQDILNLLYGATVTINEEKLDLMNEFMTNEMPLSVPILLRFGTRNLKIGFYVDMEGYPTVQIPKEIMELLLGGMDFDEDIDKEFVMFKGGIFAKTGLEFAMKFKLGPGDLGIGIRGGAYLPAAYFDENSKVNFVYRSDMDTGSLYASLYGGSKFYTSLYDVIEGSGDVSNLTSNLGYYADVGVSYLWNNFLFGFSVQDISISPAKANAFGEVQVSFEASVVNLDLNVEDPSYELSDISPISSPVDISIPMKITALAVYRYRVPYLNGSLGIHGSLIPSSSYWKIGGYGSLYDFIWLDLSYLSNGYWRKEVGIDMDLRVIRLMAQANILDVELLNFDPSKMIGVGVKVGLSMGF